MLDHDRLLEAGRQRHEERLRLAAEHRLERLVSAGRPRPIGRFRLAVARALVSAGRGLAPEQAGRAADPALGRVRP
jgi:hypothetical protein